MYRHNNCLSKLRDKRYFNKIICKKGFIQNVYLPRTKYEFELPLQKAL
jgi:hypothetical protein